MAQAVRDPELAAYRQRERQAVAHRAAQDLRLTLATPHGRRVLQGYMELFGIYSDIPPNNNATMQHLLGKRSAALVIREDVKRVNAALLPQMESELAEQPPLPVGDEPDGDQEA